MNESIATSQILKTLGIDSNTVERVLFDHRAGQPPILTVWFVPNEKQMSQVASDFVQVYRLAVRDE